MTSTIYAADLFCGCGGASAGLHGAVAELGCAVNLVAVNHWPVAIETHGANYPGAIHLCNDVEKVKPRQAVPGGRLHLLLAGPSCFPEGTLILTSDGLTPIECVKVGDSVLTHKGRWRPVTATGHRKSPTVIVRGKGHYGLETTVEHPFYTITRLNRHRPKDGSRYRYTQEKWTTAEELRPKSDMWGTPRAYDTLPVPEVEGRGVDFSPEFWWMVGRWLGDGWLRIRKSKSEVAICCGSHEADFLDAKLAFGKPTGREAAKGEYRWRRSTTRTGEKFETGHDGLAKWLEAHFGKFAHGKTIPAWVLTLPADWRRALLDGYLSADGHDLGKQIQIPTVSKRLAVGIRLLTESLGIRATLLFCPKSEKAVIEGRVVSQRPQYLVRWSKQPKREFSTTTALHSWRCIREVVSGRECVDVYNFSVEEDESYVADGIVVHNCTHFSQARGGRPTSDQQRSGAWEIVHWARELVIENILVENVPEFLTWGPVDEDTQRPCKERKGLYFRQWVRMLRDLGYTVEWRILCAAHYGDATTRKRLFIQCRKSGRITWPVPTHHAPAEIGAYPDTKPWVSAREIIDWSLPSQSIFARKKPLAENTMKRIFAGLEKFCGLTFVIGQQSGAAPRATTEPLPTIATSGAISLIEPFLVVLKGTRERQLQQSVQGTDAPLPTIHAQGEHLALCEPYLVVNRTNNLPQSLNEPIPSLTTGNNMALVEPFLLTASGPRGRQGEKSLDGPLPTVLSRNHTGVIQPYLVRYNGGDKRVESLDAPLSTLDTSNRLGIAQPYLVSFYGNGNASAVTDPLDTITTKDRFGLVEPLLDKGDTLALLDIRFRMLQPHELAAAHSFPADYQFAGGREDRVKQVGNSWPVCLATALCKAVLAA